MPISHVIENKNVNKNNHIFRLYSDHFGLHLEIGFAGDWKEKAETRKIDISIYDMKKYRTMLDEMIATMETLGGK